MRPAIACGRTSPLYVVRDAIECEEAQRPSHASSGGRHHQRMACGKEGWHASHNAHHAAFARWRCASPCAKDKSTPGDDQRVLHLCASTQVPSSVYLGAGKSPDRNRRAFPHTRSCPGKGQRFFSEASGGETLIPGDKAYASKRRPQEIVPWPLVLDGNLYRQADDTSGTF